MKKITMRENKSVPEFDSFEEEREDLESRGPLAKGYKSVLSRPESEQNRTSFLSVRLTGEELDKLGAIARERGVGPSTFARMVLTAIIEQHDRPKQPANWDQAYEKMVEVMPQSLKDQITEFSKNVKLPDIDNPDFFILDPKQMVDLYSISVRFVQFMFSNLMGSRTITAEMIERKENHKIVSDQNIIKTEA